MEIMETARNLDQIIKQLPAEAKDEVEDFARFLLEKYSLQAKQSQPRQLKLDWRGGLKEFKDQYTSVELQHETLKQWKKNVLD